MQTLSSHIWVPNLPGSDGLLIEENDATDGDTLQEGQAVSEQFIPWCHR